MTRSRITTTLAAVALAMAPMALSAQVTKPAAVKPAAKEESQAALMKEAKITLAAATATAMKEVPGAKIESHELEREKGKLIYSFDMKLAGKEGIEEVNIDAMTGAMIEHAHESPADEAKEAAADGQAALMKEAKITLAAATATAMKEVPGGKIESHELEREDGKLIYSFDIKVTGKTGVEEVAVDAMTGAMLSHEHETPAQIAKEKAADAKAAAKKKSGGI